MDRSMINIVYYADDVALIAKNENGLQGHVYNFNIIQICNL